MFAKCLNPYTCVFKINVNNKWGCLNPTGVSKQNKNISRNRVKITRTAFNKHYSSMIS